MPPPQTNGTGKRIPNLMPAPAYRSFNKPQQTVNPHFSQYGEPSELSNFKNLPELYPISSRSNATTSNCLVNGQEQSALFSATKYGSFNPRPTFSNSQVLTTPRLLGNSNTYFNNSSTKSIGLKGNSFFTSVSEIMEQEKKVEILHYLTILFFYINRAGTQRD